MGLYNEAIEAYQRALKVDPNDAATYFNLGNLYAILGKHAEAIKSWAKGSKFGSSIPQGCTGERQGDSKNVCGREIGCASPLPTVISLSFGDFRVGNSRKGYITAGYLKRLVINFKDRPDDLRAILRSILRKLPELKEHLSSSSPVATSIKGSSFLLVITAVITLFLASCQPANLQSKDMQQQKVNTQTEIVIDNAISELAERFKNATNVKQQTDILWRIGKIGMDATAAEKEKAVLDVLTELYTESYTNENSKELKRLIICIMAHMPACVNKGATGMVAVTGVSKPAATAEEKKITLDILIKLYAAENDRELKQEIIQTVGDIADNTAVDTLIKWYAFERDRELKKGIIQTVGDIADKTAVDTLIKWYAFERDRELKKEIIRAIGKQTLKYLTPGENTLIKLYIAENDRELKQEIIQTVGETREAAALNILIKLYASESGKELKKTIVSFLLGENIFPTFATYHENDFTQSLQYLIDKCLNGLSWPGRDIQQVEYNLLALKEFNGIGLFPTGDFLNICLARFTDKEFVVGKNMSDKEIAARDIILQVSVSYIIGHTQELGDAKLNTFLSQCQEYIELGKAKRSLNLESVNNFISGMLSRSALKLSAQADSSGKEFLKIMQEDLTKLPRGISEGGVLKARIYLQCYSRSLLWQGLYINNEHGYTQAICSLAFKQPLTPEELKAIINKKAGSADPAQGPIRQWQEYAKTNDQHLLNLLSTVNTIIAEGGSILVDTSDQKNWPLVQLIDYLGLADKLTFLKFQADNGRGTIIEIPRAPEKEPDFSALMFGDLDKRTNTLEIKGIKYTVEASEGQFLLFKDTKSWKVKNFTEVLQLPLSPAEKASFIELMYQKIGLLTYNGNYGMGSALDRSIRFSTRSYGPLVIQNAFCNSSMEVPSLGYIFPFSHIIGNTTSAESTDGCLVSAAILQSFLSSGENATYQQIRGAMTRLGWAEISKGNSIFPDESRYRKIYDAGGNLVVDATDTIFSFFGNPFMEFSNLPYYAIDSRALPTPPFSKSINSANFFKLDLKYQSFAGKFCGYTATVNEVNQGWFNNPRESLPGLSPGI